MVVGTVDQAFSTTDGGVTWNEAEYLPPGPTHTVPQYTAVSCISAMTCWVGADGGQIIETTDGGKSWIDRSPPSGTVQGIASLACTNASDCIASTPQGVLYSTNSGAGWARAAGGGAGRLACVSTTTCWLAGSQAGPTVEISTDGGRSWNVQSTFPSLPSQGRVIGGYNSISCPDASHCVAVGTYQYGFTAARQVVVASTADGGNTWRVDNPPTGAATLWGVSCTTPLACYATSENPGTNTVGGEILATTDGGTTWAPAYKTPGTALAVGCAGGNCWAVGYGATRSDGEGTSYIATTFHP